MGLKRVLYLRMTVLISTHVIGPIFQVKYQYTRIYYRKKSILAILINWHIIKIYHFVFFKSTTHAYFLINSRGTYIFTHILIFMSIFYSSNFYGSIYFYSYINMHVYFFLYNFYAENNVLRNLNGVL
jgi:hypothetical protein